MNCLSFKKLEFVVRVFNYYDLIFLLEIFYTFSVENVLLFTFFVYSNILLQVLVKILQLVLLLYFYFYKWFF